MQAETYTSHLQFLANELGCDLRMINPDTPGMMYVEFGYVEGPTIDPNSRNHPNIESQYMVNLHELGHFAHGHTQGRPPKENEKWYFENGVLKSEAEAWEWALDNRIPEILDYQTIDYMRNRCIGSYYRGSQFERGRKYCVLTNGNRHHVKFEWDVPTDFFWNICSRLEKGE